MKVFETKKFAKATINLTMSFMQVNHSQKMYTPWVIAEEGGKIITAHCVDCIASLGESCAHVASLLFAIESGVHIRDSMTVTKSILGDAHWCKGGAVCPSKGYNFLWKDTKCFNDGSTAHVSPTHTKSHNVCVPCQDPPPHLECPGILQKSEKNEEKLYLITISS